MAKFKNDVNWKRIEKGLEQYKEIMTLFKCSNNIYKDEVFQKKYKTFYKLNAARRGDDFYNSYFKILKKAKNEGGIEIKYVLERLHHVENKKELSFASKLLATVNPKLPIWDKNVRFRINEIGDIKLKNTYSSIEDCVKAYNSLITWYDNFMKTSDAKQMIFEFDAHFPNQKITSIKKIDFIFWQTVNK